MGFDVVLGEELLELRGWRSAAHLRTGENTQLCTGGGEGGDGGAVRLPGSDARPGSFSSLERMRRVWHG